MLDGPRQLIVVMSGEILRGVLVEPQALRGLCSHYDIVPLPSPRSIGKILSLTVNSGPSNYNPYDTNLDSDIRALAAVRSWCWWSAL